MDMDMACATFSSLSFSIIYIRHVWGASGRKHPNLTSNDSLHKKHVKSTMYGKYQVLSNHSFS